MTQLRRVAGVGLDGSNVTATLGKLQVPAIKASYGDGLEPAFLSYMGSQQQDEQTQGTYKTEQPKITVSAMVFRTIIMPAAIQNGFGNVRMSVVIGRSHPDAGDDSDLLANCRITNLPAAVENSNKAEEVELTLTCQQVFWTNARKTINQLRLAGTVPAGAIASGF